MIGLRWIFAFLRDPAGTLGGSIATIRARLAPLESRIQLTVTEALQKAARKLALGVVAAAFALVGGYVLIGLWFGLEPSRPRRRVVRSRRVVLEFQRSTSCAAESHVAQANLDR